MLPPDWGWCKSEFWAIADAGSVKSRARLDAVEFIRANRAGPAQLVDPGRGQVAIRDR